MIFIDMVGIDFNHSYSTIFLSCSVGTGRMSVVLISIGIGYNKYYEL
jgi:hypothetical protein